MCNTTLYHYRLLHSHVVIAKMDIILPVISPITVPKSRARITPIALVKFFNDTVKRIKRLLSVIFP